MGRAIKAAAPEGIDVDLEISGYNDTEPPPGPRSFGNLLVNRVRLQGFIILDYYPRFGEAIAELSKLMAEGKLKAEATVVEGFEELPNALNMLFAGENTGKLVVQIDG